MTMPRIALFAFALWTMAVPLGAVGVYRWSRILRGKQAIHTFRSDAVEGADWYRRAMRAHANCVENLPVFGAIVWTLDGLALRGSMVDALAALVVVCRVGQSTVHLGWTETARSVSIRFALFFAQLVCMGALSAKIVAALLRGEGETLRLSAFPSPPAPLPSERGDVAARGAA